MNIVLKRIIKILKWIVIVILSLTAAALAVRAAGRMMNNRTPDGGLNETMYIDVNGQEQWINIYGEDRDNPVLLYLHGGPACPTSYADWVIFRKLAGDYTIVNWDQRNSGKTWMHDPQTVPVTPELMRSDIDIVADYILDYMGKDKLTVLGMSWGTMYGGDYVRRHPEKVECFIALSLAYDMREVLNGDKRVLLELSSDNNELHDLAEEYDPVYLYTLTAAEKEAWLGRKTVENDQDMDARVEKAERQSMILQTLYDAYMPEAESIFDGDVNMIGAVFFNPYYSLSDLCKLAGYNSIREFDVGEEITFLDEFSLKDTTSYEMPFYVMQGENDDISGVQKEYYDRVSAPDKDFRYISGGGHMSTMLNSGLMAEYVHEIAEKMKR